MSDFLKQMAAHSAERTATAKAYRAADFDKPVVPLTLDAFDIIAEIKERSPAEGDLMSAGQNRADLAKHYANGGAAAISVLTEPSRFSGELDHLQEVAAAVPGTPVMRKDFLVDPVQVLEGRAAGASGVLLIVTMLSDATLRAMLDRANEHRMFVLLESFDEEDLRRTRQILNTGDQERAADGQLLFGINTRDLRTLEVDPNRLGRLASALPQGKCVAESGLHKPEDAAKVASYGYSIALVGTALMRSSDPTELIAAMREAGSVGLAA